MKIELLFSILGFKSEHEKLALIKLLHASSAFDSDIYSHLFNDKTKDKHINDAYAQLSCSNLRTIKDSLAPDDKVIFHIPPPENHLTDEHARTLLNNFSFSSGLSALKWFNHFGQAVWFRGVHIESQQLQARGFDDYIYEQLRILGLVDKYYSSPKDKEYDLIIQFGASEEAVKIRQSHGQALGVSAPYTALLGSDRFAWPIHEPCVTQHLVKATEGKRTAEQINAIFYTFLAQALIDQGNFVGSFKTDGSERNSDLSAPLYKAVLAGVQKKQSPIACIKEAISPYTDTSALAKKLFDTPDQDFLKTVAREININHFRNAILHHFAVHENVPLTAWPRETDVMEAVFKQDDMRRVTYDADSKKISGQQISSPGVFSVHTATYPEHGKKRADTKDTLEALKQAIEEGYVPSPKDRPMRILAISTQPDARTQHMVCQDVLRDTDKYQVDVAAPAVTSKTPNIGLFLSALAATTYRGLGLAAEQITSVEQQQPSSVFHHAVHAETKHPELVKAVA